MRPNHYNRRPFPPPFFFPLRYNFLKLRAALTLHYQGPEPLVSRIEPRPGSSDYTTLVASLAQRFAAAFVHGGDLTAGTLPCSISLFSLSLSPSLVRALSLVGVRGIGCW